MAGVRVPLVAMKHAYVVTDTIPDIRGMPNVRDHDASVYLKLQGEVLCIGGYETNPIFLEEVQLRRILKLRAFPRLQSFISPSFLLYS